MADDLDLFYLIEGTQQRFHISVSYNSNGRPVKVGALRQIIFNRKCKDLAPDDDNLTLLKVGNSLSVVSFRSRTDSSDVS